MHSPRKWIWWTVLTMLVFGLPQCSLLVTNTMDWIPLGNSLNTALEFAASYAILGVSTALPISPSLVILAAIFLRARSGPKRMAMAVGYVVIHCLVTGVVLVASERRWITQAMMDDADYGPLIGHLLLAPALSFASVFPAAAMHFFGGWTITIDQHEMKTQRVGVLVLMEWVLVSALIFSFFRASFAVNDQSRIEEHFYGAVVLMLPAVGVGMVAVLLLRWILSEDRSRGGFRRLLMIALIQFAVFATALGALQLKDPSLGLNWNLQLSAAPLSTCLTGTVIAGVVVVCLRRLGYRLRSRGELRRLGV